MPNNERRKRGGPWAYHCSSPQDGAVDLTLVHVCLFAIVLKPSKLDIVPNNSKYCLVTIDRVSWFQFHTVVQESMSETSTTLVWIHQHQYQHCEVALLWLVCPSYEPRVQVFCTAILRSTSYVLCNMDYTRFGSRYFWRQHIYSGVYSSLRIMYNNVYIHISNKFLVEILHGVRAKRPMNCWSYSYDGYWFSEIYRKSQREPCAWKGCTCTLGAQNVTTLLLCTLLFLRLVRFVYVSLVCSSVL